VLKKRREGVGLLFWFGQCKGEMVWMLKRSKREDRKKREKGV
jgi:hypothetical protein